MRFFKDNNYKKLAIVISIPILLIAQYYLFKIGVFKPMVKGIEVSISNGDYIKDLDKFTIKLDEEVTLDSGNYITIPSYSKQPKIWFKELDEDNILHIKDDKIVGLKEGIASVGIMKDSRVLRKKNIKVVKQKVTDVTVTANNDINYVGDSTKIDAKVDVDYDRFKEKEAIYYTSTNESVLKVENNKINAVGVGKANILVKSGDIEKILSYNISAKIANIKIDNVIELLTGETKKLNPQIITSPTGLKPGQIKYELVDAKLPIQRAISINKNGKIVALREGEEKVKITCGNKSKIITIKVTDKQHKIQNISYQYEIVDEKLIITFVWDYINDINQYGIYIKNNSLGDNDYKLFDTINTNPNELLDSNKVKTTIELDLVGGRLPDISIYIVGITPNGETEKSDIINIKPKDIVDEKVEHLEGYLDSENNIRLSWKPINIESITYSIYIKDNLNKENGFVLYQNGIQENHYIIPVNNENIDIDIYVVGNEDGKNSNQSNIINIKK